jgi:ferric-dicitrate binding protein FerR (iron transport regulator)
MQVEVLGTHFNINSYGDEGVIKTTLLEGKVRVTRNGAIAILKPGQQAIVSLGVDYPPPVINRSPDLDKTMAWKDNRFYFEDDDIISIMAQLERWYDIRVVYDDQVSNQYTGIISRNVPISKVLELFERIGDIRFTVEGHTVHVKAVK